MRGTGASHTCARILRHTRHARRRKVRGFTLVELMVTIFLAAILITIAVPSFQHIIASTKLTATANAMVSRLNVARMQAIKRNTYAQFCANLNNGPGLLGASCVGNATAVYVLTGTAAVGGTVKAQAPAELNEGQQELVGDVIPLRFDPQGLAHAINDGAPFKGDIATICSSAMSTDNRRVIHMITGSIIDIKTTSGACP